jgi:tetratricopeptide (TPR) repeat protein
MNSRVSLLMASLVCLLSAGCATPPPPLPAQATLNDLFHDEGIRAPRPAQRDLFALSAPMKAFMNSEAFRIDVWKNGAELGLADALYRKELLKLEYDDSMTRDAATTFADRKGNCLSLVIMTAAFAKAMKIEVHYQHVRISTEWSRNNNMYVGSTHVNIGLGSPRRAVFQGAESPGHITIDFVPPPNAGEMTVTRISESTITAMYLNNRAVEEMSAGRLDEAYWLARAAVQQDPGLITAYNTLGVIYQKRGLAVLSERVFKRALERAPEDTILMSNLAPLLAAMGKADESRAVAARAASLLPEPPYYYFEMGMKAMAEANYAEAKELFAREVRRAPFNHEFHYWLGLAHLRMGEVRSAREQLAIAVQNSSGGEAQRYSSKLALLRSYADTR